LRKIITTVKVRDDIDACQRANVTGVLSGSDSSQISAEAKAKRLVQGTVDKEMLQRLRKVHTINTIDSWATVA
jgi:hypothetical protein